MPRPKANETAKGGNPHVSKRVKETAPETTAEKFTPLCHIHDNVKAWDIIDIRKNVCVVDQPWTEFEGEYYCLFHLPAKDKDAHLFGKILSERMKSVENKIADAEFESSNKKISYDFRYLVFPKTVYFKDYRFVIKADFGSATFINKAFFTSATFAGEANFNAANFKDEADFNKTVFANAAFFRQANFSEKVVFRGATIKGDADFISATFSGVADFISLTFTDSATFWSVNFAENVYFNEAKFMQEAEFLSVKFMKDAYFGSTVFAKEAKFDSAVFSALAYFTKAEFSGKTEFNSSIFAGNVYFTRSKLSKTSETFFIRAKFEKDTFFDRARFRNDVSFNSVILGKDSDIFFRRTFFAKTVNFQYCTAEGLLHFVNLIQGKANRLDFDNAAFEKAARVEFHTVRLRPNWFINTDCRKFVFSACRWKKEDGKNISTKSELENSPHKKNIQLNKILTKTCWQLADNHEEMKSFPKASIFRQMANESKRLEDFDGWKIWSLHWWYWLTSYYGERPLQAGLILTAILLFFALLFILTDFQVCSIVKTMPETPCDPRTLNFGEGILQSLATATFQNIEYFKPNSKITTFIIVLEKIFVPLQAALLALAIRRKFMR